MQDFRGKAFLFAQQTQQQVLRPDVFVVQALGFFSAVCEDALALVAQREIDGRRNLFTNSSVPLNLLPDGIDRRVRTQETVRQLLVLPQKSEKQVLRFDIWTAELTRLIACEKN